MPRENDTPTQGPWKMAKHTDTDVFEEEWGIYYSNGEPDPIALVGEKVDAHLFVAAPNLLDASRKAMEDLGNLHAWAHEGDSCKGCETCQNTLPALMAAIAKATGKEQEG